MADDGYPRNQFDRFAQDDYLQALFGAQTDEIIPMLFSDMMNRVNLIEGQAELILAELERADETRTAPQSAYLRQSSGQVLSNAVALANILKALLEYDVVGRVSGPPAPDTD